MVVCSQLSLCHVIAGSHCETNRFMFVYFMKKVTAIPPPNMAGTANQLKPTSSAAPLIP